MHAARALGLAAVVWALPASAQSVPAASAESSGQPLPFPAPPGPRDPEQVKKGSVLVAVGAAALATATVLLVAYLGEWARYDGETFGCGGVADCPNELTLKPGPELAYGALMSGLVGGALVGIGVSMLVSGAKPAPADPPRSAWWVPRRVAIDKQRVALTFEARW